MRELTIGTEPNSFRVLVKNPIIEGFARLNRGLIESGVILHVSNYSLEDVLTQMLEDYGEEELIKRINLLR